mgnify:CR=1 FL=1
MKIKHGMILAAGLGKRMKSLTLNKPKPLIKIGNKTLLGRAIELLINHGVEEIVINVHYLAEQIKNFINDEKYNVKITISEEKDLLLDTGGGILKATKLIKKPFIVINPDTLWSKSYSNELKNLENLYSEKKKSCLLLVNKDLSFDSSFIGDFNLDDEIISRGENNQFIFTGLQILDQSVFSSTKNKIFSMNQIWDLLIKDSYLTGVQSKQKFYHLNTKEMYDKILNLNITY